jgi:DNA invertase Pin-like site-specific DNA recombinase
MLALIYVFTIWCLATILYASVEWLETNRRLALVIDRLRGQEKEWPRRGAEKVFAEKISGARRDRPALERCLGSLEPGDTVLVTKLDPLARSTRDLLNVLALITDFGSRFKSLGDPWADTTTPHGRLMLTVLGGLAEFGLEGSLS